MSGVSAPASVLTGVKPKLVAAVEPAEVSTS